MMIKRPDCCFHAHREERKKEGRLLSQAEKEARARKEKLAADAAAAGTASSS